MRKQVTDAEVKINNGTNTTENNGSGSELQISTSLLASKNRDFLLSPSGSLVKSSDLEGKFVGIYFSANWHPPCRVFTRELTNAYEQLRNSDAAFEVVFVSSDEGREAYNNYFATMPWLAIPFSDLESRRALSQRFDIEAIPSLVLLQPDGENSENSIILDGVDVIYRYGIQAYPFTKNRLEELLQKEKDKHENQTLQSLLCNNQRDYLIISHGSQKQVSVASLTGKTIGLYFSAQWCSPGEKFTPTLASVYSKINEACSVDGGHTGFEIVFVSSDHDHAAFDAYFETMQWLAIPYNDENIRDLVRHFDVQGIPCLVILGPDGKTVTKNGRRLVNLYKERAYPYTDERIKELEKEANEEAKDFVRQRLHSGHCHELRLVSEGHGGGAFICCECDEQGAGWAYQCIRCGYELHPKCVRAVEQDQTQIASSMGSS